MSDTPRPLRNEQSPRDGTARLVRIFAFSACLGLAGCLISPPRAAGNGPPPPPVVEARPAASIPVPVLAPGAHSGAPVERPADDGVYLRKSEFEAFLRQYRLERHAETPPHRNDVPTLTPGYFPPKPESRPTFEQQPTLGPEAEPLPGLKPISKSGGCLAWKKGAFTFTPYGYINLSASYETEKTTTGDFCVYANSPDFDGHAGFHIDPRSTRLGLTVDGPGLPGWRGSKTQGAVEVDFQGNYTLRNRSALLLRKAFVSVGDKKLRFLAGQDWEVVSPLYPKTLNYTAGAGVGNVGYRRAMLRVDRNFDLGGAGTLAAQFALTDNILRDGFNVGGLTPHAGSWPVLQGRLAWSFGEGRFRHGKPMTFGVSSHIGEQRFEFDEQGVRSRKYARTWSLNADVDLPVTRRLGFQLEYFLGENLGTIEGGILQGFDLAIRKTIRAQGGWAGLQYRWTSKLETNVCYQIDDPFDEDVVAGNSSNHLSRTYNHCIFANMLYHWSDALMTGFELSFWRTHWQKYDPVSRTVTPLRPGTPVRYEFVTRYTF